ncbi:MAG: S24 family peptidase [Mesosutterella sp.]|nr:S24 family peptidase [Mesosutterella sp.]
MKTASEIRYENLMELLRQFKSVGDLNVAIGRPRADSTLRQIKSGTRFSNGHIRLMGDAVAREIEDKLRLERGWMDHEHGADKAPEERVLRLAISRPALTDGRADWSEDPQAAPRSVLLEASWAAERGISAEGCVAALSEDDAMDPLIQKGDAVVIERAAEGAAGPFAGGIYAVLYNGRLRCCRLQTLLDGTLSISYENTRFPREQIPAAMAEKGLVVLGAVLAVSRLRVF